MTQEKAKQDHKLTIEILKNVSISKWPCPWEVWPFQGPETDMTKVDFVIQTHFELLKQASMVARKEKATGWKKDTDSPYH